MLPLPSTAVLVLYMFTSVTVSTTVQVFASNKRMVTAAPAVHCSTPTVHAYLSQFPQQYQHLQATRRCLLMVSTHTIHAYLSQFPQQYQYSQATRGQLSLPLQDTYCTCISVTISTFASNKRTVITAPAVHCSTRTAHVYLSQFPQQYQYSQTKRGWLSLSLHPCSCRLSPEISNPNFPTKTNP